MFYLPASYVADTRNINKTKKNLFLYFNFQCKVVPGDRLKDLDVNGASLWTGDMYWVSA